VRHHPKSVLAITLSIAVSIWWLSIQNYSSTIDEREYSRQECAEDLCQVNCDLAQFALNRGDSSAAISLYQKAINHKADALLAYQRLSSCYQHQGLREKAVQTYLLARQATASVARLSEDSRTLLHNPLPWQGEPLSGKKIYVQADDTEEDCLCFIRFVPALLSQGATVFCKVPDVLSSLCQQSLPQMTIFSDLSALQLPTIDYYVTIQSLPALLKVSGADFQVPNYLMPAAEQVAAAKKLLPAQKLRVGLWCQGARQVSVPASLCRDFTQLPHVQMYTLQPNQQVLGLGAVDLSAHCRTLADAAAVIKNLDLLLTIEAPIAHLAGALGVSTWLMLASKPVDWRWAILGAAQQAAWYASVRVFKQPVEGDWVSVAADIYEALSVIGNTPLARLLPTNTAIAAATASDVAS
jgi:hypothetical protein